MAIMRTDVTLKLKVNRYKFIYLLVYVCDFDLLVIVLIFFSFISQYLRHRFQKNKQVPEEQTAIGFNAGVLSCLEYLEAAPWAKDEEEKVASLLSELRLERIGAGKVLKKVSLDVTSGVEDMSDNEELLLKLFTN
ncbi:BTB/POZ domain-containing protein-like [Forsythia ovata]|uniref:BTB/POZ domain-containing protein-like n=1 Tax=Forsythia ovata TaxID=205694 RepID=A0ABD1VE12_9LAMI